jgi:hypothetical protein
MSRISRESGMAKDGCSQLMRPIFSLDESHRSEVLAPQGGLSQLLSLATILCR